MSKHNETPFVPVEKDLAKYQKEFEYLDDYVEEYMRLSNLGVLGFTLAAIVFIIVVFEFL